MYFRRIPLGTWWNYRRVRNSFRVNGYSNSRKAFKVLKNLDLRHDQGI